MMRSIITTGMILGFIGCAFVSPTDANFHSISEMAKSQEKIRMSNALFGQTMNPVSIRKAVVTLQKASKDPSVSAALTKAGAALNSDEMNSVVQVLREVTPETKAMTKRVTSAVSTALVLRKTSSYWKQIKIESGDKKLVSRMEDIEWAVRKTNVRLCRDIASDLLSTHDAPSQGDYLALCLGKVTGDMARCNQINSERAPIIKKLCIEELAT